MKNYILILLTALALSSCDDLFSPANENFKDPEQMHNDPTYAQGFLMHAYRSIPTYYDNTEYATDDAVTNQKGNNMLNMATGSWASNNNPVNQWDVCLGNIQNLNLFLNHVDQVKWAEDPEVSKLFTMRTKGEAYALRAIFMYYLMRNHAGFANDGTLLGVPILNEFLDTDDDFNLPRASFEDCIQQIYSDLELAEQLLPDEYNRITSPNDIPAKYHSVTQKADVYNRVMGEYGRQLINGLIVKSFRARTSLLAASPAYQNSSNTGTWEKAANDVATVLNYIGGINGIDPNGHTYYANISEIDGLKEGLNPKEIIWRENLSTGNSTQEEQNFPPSLFGKGYMNPTQNLVDAFPMANGYPIKYSDQSKSGYNPSNPYAGRDPRLSHYIIYNGSSDIGVSKATILTGSQSGTDDGINRKETSTRTGYYMKKRLRMDVNRNPASITGKTHYTPRIRYTEMFLNYAEAANEAWGPTGSGSHSFSAYEVIKAIRKRAGVGGNNDPYLEECKANKDQMRELIRNERRLELCFESFRFWDLRRWKNGINLNETATGMDVNNNVYTPINVENRNYEDYMFYGPVPHSELLKYDKLVQNEGW